MPGAFRRRRPPPNPTAFFVFTLCDAAAGEPMPEWPRQPVTAHWRSTDPVLVQGEEWERKQAFVRALSGLEGPCASS